MDASRLLMCDRFVRFAAACLFVSFAFSAVAADIAPYEARVATPRAQVRSGPGEKFYPTDTLTWGESVEVYREDDDGWLAIRPPEKSFSWVLERQLKFRDDGLAEVDDANVASRIGSRLNDQRNAVQVQLKKGEVVEVLDKQTIDGKTWCKIAPPAGEFRWVHATNVQRVGPLAEPEAEDPAESPVVTASATNETAAEKTKPSEVEAPPLIAEPAPAPGEQWRAPGAGSNTAPAENGLQPLTPIATPAAQPTTTPTAAVVSPPVAAAPVANSPPPTDELQRQLTEIEMRLSRMAAASPHLWNTERLERDTEQLLSQAQSDADRNAVKVTMAKIDQFAMLGRRYQQGPAGSGPGDPRTTAAAGQPIAPPAGQPGGLPAEAGRYDAVGILRPVISKRPGAPQFALVDERGQVVSFVTPSPDVNLQPYLGRRVGIAGNRGFMPEFNRAHVTAGRVTPLAQGMVR